MEHVQKIEVSDIGAIEISCDVCETTVSLKLGSQYPSLGQPCRCVSCGEALWNGEADTSFAQALIRATGQDSRSSSPPATANKSHCYTTATRLPSTLTRMVSVPYRERSRFRNARAVDDQFSMTDATSRLIRECRLLGAANVIVIVSTNVAVRRDGLPYARQRTPEESSVECRLTP